MKILSCNSNRPLAEAIAAYLDVPLTKADVRRFADMEVFVEIGENVRGEDVFVIQSTCFPANDNVMELLVAVDALRRGSARRRRGGRGSDATGGATRAWSAPRTSPAGSGSRGRVVSRAAGAGSFRSSGRVSSSAEGSRGRSTAGAPHGSEV